MVAWSLGPTLGKIPSSCSSSAQSLLSLGMKALTPRTCSPSIPPSLPSSISPLVARRPSPPAALQFGESQRRDLVSPGAFRRRIGTRRAPWQNPHRGMPAASCYILYPLLYVPLRMGAVGLLGGYEPAAGPSRCFVRSIKSRLTGLDPGCRRFGPGRAITPNSQGERL